MQSDLSEYLQCGIKHLKLTHRKMKLRGHPVDAEATGALGRRAALWVAVVGVAALLELGGAWLVWGAVRGGRPLGFALLGAGLLLGYALIQTLQPAPFARVYAAYGGWFIMASVLWGWAVDGQRPERVDALGVLLCIAGASLIFLGPRSA